jgi:phosphate:Na+ symporter
MDIYSIFQIAGGVGLFLFGMKFLGQTLERLAGAGLEKTLAKLTNNRLYGLLLGVIVTAAIQSSSATNIMLVGFVNAGIIKFVQAIPVVLGASIGTTVTGQILRLGDISDSGSTFLSLMKPSSFAPVIICIGAFMMLLSKKKKTKEIASLLLGFGILFFGMTTMETAFKPLEESEGFRKLFTAATNPFLGILIGFVVCTILQSASASVGILQAVSSGGAVSFAVAAPIIIGINIGKAFPVILASLSAKKDAKRTAFVGFITSTIIGVLCLVIVYGIIGPFRLYGFEKIMTRGSVANFNTILNVAGSLLLLPLTGALDRFCRFVIKEGKPSKIDEQLALLDDILLKNPSIALEQCQKVVDTMGATALENFRFATDLLNNYDEKILPVIDENEQFMDKSETVLSDYIVKITSKDIHHDEALLATEILHSVTDFERIGDHCVKLSEVATYDTEQKISFSEAAQKEISTIASAVEMVLNITTDAFFNGNPELASKVEPLNEVIDRLRETIRNNHVVRLQKGNCSVQSGISLVELLNSFERISAYCSNIALNVIARYKTGGLLDTHGYTEELKENSDAYKTMVRQYSEEFAVPELSVKEE